jgi:DNA adenine methylase
MPALDRYLKAPFPYFGGKARVTARIWAGLGDVAHYIEPFCGSAIVLLRRPDYDPTRHVETINDLDGMICNVWRAIARAPDEVVQWCDWPVSHIDLIARKRALNERYAELVSRLCADPDAYDAELAGLYIWAASCWIGHGLIHPKAIPHLGDAGNGVHAKGKRPHLAHAGKGVHAKGQIPHLCRAGKGVHAKGSRSDLYEWFAVLSARLRRVRTICGDWRRVCGGNWQTGPGRPVGIVFDPPYGVEADRDERIYAQDDLNIAAEVRDWCLARGAGPDYRICLAGYYEEHESLLAAGWSVHRWKAHGGYGHIGNGKSKGKLNRHREALFFSPHCMAVARRQAQMALFEETLEQGECVTANRVLSDERRATSCERRATSDGSPAT